MTNNKKSKLTLIIDGNWLLMSRLYVMNNKYQDESEMLNEMKVLMIRSINVVLRQFPLIDNIIFVSDGGSWRNQINIPNIPGLIEVEDGEESQVEYKGNREKSDDMDWTAIFEAYDEFRQVLQMNGINVYHENGIEGDDWVWYWTNKLNNEGTNCIIWTKDHDLMQLVKTSKDKCFTIWWNKDNGIFTEEVNEDDMNFLFNPLYSENENIYNYLCNKSVKTTQIKPMSIIIDKIIRGDAGDNIQPILLRNGKSNPDKKYKVSPKDVPLDLNINNKDDVKEYIEHILNTNAYKNRVDKSEEQILEHFDYNKKLVYLAKEEYPDYIIETFNNYKTYNCNKDLSQAEADLNATKNSMNNILELI